MSDKPNKVDEQISYNWLFFLLAGAFGAVTFWAVYDETATRREYKLYQEAFFHVDGDLAKKAWDEAKAKLESSPAWKQATADLQKRKDDLQGGKASEYKTALANLQEQRFLSDDKTQDYTFTKSNLDETYYYFTVAKHEVTSETPKDSPAYRHFDEKQKQYQKLVDQLVLDDKAAAAELAKTNCLDKGRSAESPTCEVMNAADYLAANFQSGGRTVAVRAYTDAIKQLEKQIDDLERPVKELERRYLATQGRLSSGPLGLFGPATEVIQRNVEEIGRVDRCESCHLGTTKGGYEKITPNHFRSHPNRRTLLAIHPPDKVGCTTCHDGQGRATTEFHAHAPVDDHHDFEIHFWEKPLLKGPFMESQCRQCHRQEYDLRANLRCEVDAECPNGQKCGPLAVPIAPQRDADKALDAKLEDGKFCGTTNGGDETKIDPVLADLAPHLSRGRRIIEETACYGCHPIEGYENRPKAGPDLRHAKDKLNSGWMVDWIVNPKAIRPHNRMPNFFPERLHVEEYPDTAKPKYGDGFEQVLKIAERDPDKRHRALDLLTLERFQPEQQAALMASFIIANSVPLTLADPSAIPAGDAARGKEYVEQLGCYGCHNVTAPDAKKVEHKNRASHYDYGPDLGNVGAKTTREWLFTWLKNPKGYAPHTRMPDMRLSDQEAADISTWLAGNKYVNGAPKEYRADLRVHPEADDYTYLGKKLVNFYGCYGCHYMKGFEQTAGIGAELTEFGLKETSRLDYGDYIVKHTQQTWEVWLENKLKHPRVYRYERAETKMPQFDLTPEEIEDVMVVMKGMRGRTIDDDVRGHKLSAMEQERERGRELVRTYNCNGCHTLDGREGEIRALSIYQGDGEDGSPKIRFAPPLILGEGAKTQPQWLFGFLRQPSPLRPHLKVRMPTFGFDDKKATTLVAMFSALDGAEYPYHDYSGYTLDGDRRAQADTVFKLAQCTLCHTRGETPSPDIAAKGAPNLLLAKSRLRGDWLARWIRDPGLLYPGVNMPGFFPPTEAGKIANPLAGSDQNPANASLPGVHDISKMDGADVIYLLRDYLMTLGASSGQAAAPSTVPATGKPKARRGAAAPAPVKHASL